jgi:nicotinamide riboside kinase
METTSTFRIAITGPESSGKTTLGKALSAHLNGIFVEEYARIHLSEKGLNYTAEDVLQIAKEQFRLNHESATAKLVICDTEMLVTSIWYQEKYAVSHPELEELVNRQDVQLFVLCAPDIPWEHDPLRENPTDRERLFKLYEQELISRKLPFIIAQGDLANRVDAILRALPKSDC